MSIDDYRADVRALLERFLAEASETDDKALMVQMYTDELALLHGRYAHRLLEEVMADAHTRLDARLAPDPLRQTIASVQTTVQDIWRTLWGPPNERR
jgi:hypothetical protein